MSTNSVRTSIEGEDIRELTPLVNRIIKVAPSKISQIIMCCAITHWFDAETIAWMGSKEEAESKRVLNYLVINYTFVRPYPTRGYTYHENVRAAILIKLKTEDPQYYLELNRRAAAFFEYKTESATVIEEHREFMREQVYHLLPSDEEKGFQLFLKMYLGAKESNRVSECQTLLELTEESRRTLSPEYQFQLCHYWGELYTGFGKINEAMSWNEEALRIAREMESNSQIALINYELGTNYKRIGEFDESLELLKESLNRYKCEKGANAQVAEVLLGIAITLTYMDQFDEAAEAYEESLSYSDEVKHAETKHRIGWLRRIQGRLDESLELHQEAISKLESLGEVFLKGKALHSLGNVLAEQHNHEGALDTFASALEIFERLEAGRHMALAIRDRSWSQFQLGDVDGALDSVRLAIGQLDRIGDKAGCAGGHLAIGQILLRVGHLEDAEHHLLTAYTLEQPVASQYSRVVVNGELALLMALRHRFDKVEQLASPVETYAKSNDMHNLEARMKVVRAAVALAQSNLDLAATMFWEALEIACTWNKYFPHDIANKVAWILRSYAQGAKPASEIAEKLVSFLGKSKKEALQHINNLLENFSTGG